MLIYAAPLVCPNDRRVGGFFPFPVKERNLRQRRPVGRERFADPKSKAEVHAVEDANFDVRSGELVTLLGPSGCGKTTTLRMIGGFELPTKGKILIGDTDVTYLPPNGRQTATVFQSYGLFPHMDVFDNVAYGLKIRKLSHTEIENRVRTVLELVGLAELAHRDRQLLHLLITSIITEKGQGLAAAGWSEQGIYPHLVL